MNLRPSSLLVLALTVALLGRAETAARLSAQEPTAGTDLGQDLIGADVRSKLPTRLFGGASRAEPVLVLYRWWTDACPFCERSLPALEELRTKYEAQGLCTVAVYHPKPARSVPDDEIRARAEKLGYHGPLAADLDWALIRGLWLSTGSREATSASFLVDDGGVVRHVHPGPEFHASSDPEHARCDADLRAIEGRIQELLRPQVTLAALIEEMLDPASATLRPEPPYQLDENVLHSSLVRMGYLRAISNIRPTPDDIALDGEQIIVSEPGPGAIVRMVCADPGTRITITLDDAETVLVAKGDGTFEPPMLPRNTLWSQQGQTGILRLPIPFRKHCSITTSGTRRSVPSVSMRRYEAGTRVETLTLDSLAASSSLLARASTNAPSVLPTDQGFDVDYSFTLSKSVPEGLLFTDGKGARVEPRAIHEIHLRIDDPDLAQALPLLVVRMSFDGLPCVDVPLLDFFGTAPDPRRIDTARISVSTPGEFVCRWVMPYEKRFDFSVVNLGSKDVHVAGLLRTRPWQWTDRSRHFHARWFRRAAFFAGQLPEVYLRGSGLLVGEALSIASPSPTAWTCTSFSISAEAASRLPSFLGCFENLYGLGREATSLFSNAYQSRSRLDGPGQFGFMNVLRTRDLDAIPYANRLVVDAFGGWCGGSARTPMDPMPYPLDTCLTLFTYEAPGNEVSRDVSNTSSRENLVRAIPRYRLPRALECEAMTLKEARGVERRSTPIVDDPQHPRWSSGAGLVVRVQPAGSRVALHGFVPRNRSGRDGADPALPIDMEFHHARLYLFVTKGPDHPRIRVSVPGQDAPLDFDAYAPIASAPIGIDLGTLPVEDEIDITVETIGMNAAAKSAAPELGLDCFVFYPDFLRPKGQ